MKLFSVKFAQENVPYLDLVRFFNMEFTFKDVH